MYLRGLYIFVKFTYTPSKHHHLLLSIITSILIFSFPISSTVAAYVQSSPIAIATTINSTIATIQQLQECKKLGIKPEKCSDDSILSKYCLGPNCGVEGRLPKLELPIYTIMIGCSVALVVGVIMVIRLRKLRKKNIQRESG